MRCYMNHSILVPDGWDLPGVDRSLCIIYILDTYSNLFTVLWCFDKLSLRLVGGEGESGVNVIMMLSVTQTCYELPHIATVLS